MARATNSEMLGPAVIGDGVIISQLEKGGALKDHRVHALPVWSLWLRNLYKVYGFEASM